MRHELAEGAWVHYADELLQRCVGGTVINTPDSTFTVDIRLDLGIVFPTVEGVVLSLGNADDTAGGIRCNRGDRAYSPGTWHWPETI
jgi:hypothetical protein